VVKIVLWLGLYLIYKVNKNIIITTEKTRSSAGEANLNQYIVLRSSQCSAQRLGVLGGRNCFVVRFVPDL